MLSIEKPPSDPPCAPRDVSPSLKNSAVCDDANIAAAERANSDSQHKLALQGGVDLFQSGFDFSTLPKFSIRDYVYNSRAKNIEANWPFSQRNLQRCLKHGLTDPLPPFQSLDEIRNQPFKRCVTHAPLLEKLSAANILDQTTSSEPGNHAVLSSTGDVPTDNAAADTDTDSRKSSGEKDFVTAVHPRCDNIDSVPTTPSLLEPSAATAGPSLPSPKTRGGSVEHLGKKCRLIVKLGSASDPKTADHIASNCTEAMASKVCPVCRTFSSSSNTTLNAHIDQCLSVESTAVCMPDSRLAKHRIKPRKTRSMVDICATAPPCTLEDLDRRNGSTWAVTSASPTPDPKVGEKEKSQRTLPIHREDNDDEAGDVYFDANGTKVRILSKLSDAPSSVLRVEEWPCTTLKKSKGKKCISSNKKKSQLHKHDKYLKLAPPAKTSGSPRACKFEIHRLPQEGNSRENCNEAKKRHQKQLFKSQEQIKPTAAGSLRPWVCSKRSGLSKKVNSKDIRQLSGCNLHVARDLLVENGQSNHCNSNAERRCLGKSSNSSENPSFSPERIKRVENSKYVPCVSGDREHLPTRKRAPSPLGGVQISDDVGRPPDMLKKNGNQSTKDSISMHDSFTTSLSSKKIKNQSRQLTNFDNSSERKTKLSWGCNKTFSEAMRIPGFKNNMLSVGQLSVHESRAYVHKKCIPSKKPRLHFTAEIDDEVEESSSSEDQQYSFTCDDDENESHMGITDKVFLSGRMESGSISQWEESTMSKSFQSSPQGYFQDVGRKIVASVMSNDDYSEKFDTRESAPRESRLHLNNACFDPSLDPQYRKVAKPFDTHSNSPRSFEKFNLPLCRAEASMDLAERSLDHGMFCAREDGNDIVGQNVSMGAELHSKIDQANFFSEVEPIPIPGPPGSYLPSPRDMSSEDFQGNSSLTTSRVQSSQDLQELVDGYSTDSPISATSTISNPIVAGSDLKCSDLLLPAEPLRGIQGIVSSGFLGASVVPVPQTASPGMERSFMNGENFKLDLVIPEKQPLSFKDDHRCCCSRKERISQTVALNDQKSDLLRRRALSMLKPLGCNPDVRTKNPAERPEMCSFGNDTSYGFEKVPVTKSLTGLLPMKISPSTAVRFSSHGDCDSAASPSAPSPILRLMGKNLVVNKDEDPSADDVKYNEGLRRSHLTFSAGNNKSRPTGSISNYQPQNPPIGHGEQNGSFLVTPSRRPSAGPVTVSWGCTSDSSEGVLQRNNPFMASPAAAVHPLRSALYYSPRLS